MQTLQTLSGSHILTTIRTLILRETQCNHLMSLCRYFSAFLSYDLVVCIHLRRHRCRPRRCHCRRLQFCPRRFCPPLHKKFARSSNVTRDAKTSTSSGPLITSVENARRRCYRGYSVSCAKSLANAQCHGERKCPCSDLSSTESWDARERCALCLNWCPTVNTK